MTCLLLCWLHYSQFEVSFPRVLRQFFLSRTFGGRSGLCEFAPRHQQFPRGKLATPAKQTTKDSSSAGMCRLRRPTMGANERVLEVLRTLVQDNI